MILSLALPAGAFGVEKIFPEAGHFLITLMGAVMITALANSLAAGLACPYLLRWAGCAGLKKE